MNLTTDDLMLRVEKGAAWLDTANPGWWQRVDLDSLDLMQPCDCVLGQSFESTYGLVLRRQRKSFTWAAKHGFAVDVSDGEKALWACDEQLLRECWVTTILTRRAKAVQAVATASVTA